jgi:hypothetical protein
MQRIGRQLCCVASCGRKAAQLSGDVVRGNARCAGEELALDELDDRAGGGSGGGAAACREAGLRDAVAFDSHRDPDEVTAGGTAGRSRVWPSIKPSLASRHQQVVRELRAVTHVR